MWLKIIKDIYNINYDGLFNYRRLNRFIRIIKLVKKVNPKKILDFGCGAGAYSIYLQNKGYDIKGIDINKNLIKKAKLHDSDIDFNVGNIYKTNFRKKFDLVMLLSVILHLKNKKKAIINVHKSLSKKGNIIITIPSEYYQKKFGVYNPTYKGYMSEKDLIDLISPKFKIIDTIYSGSYIERFLKQIDFKKTKVGEIKKFNKSKLFNFYKSIIFPILSFVMLIDNILPKINPMSIIVLAQKK